MSNTAIEKHDNATSAPERVEQATYFTPLVDVIETGDGFIFQADLPGVKPADLDVSYRDGMLTIEGKVQPRQPAGHGYLWHEYGVGHFYRQFTLGTEVNADGIRAELKNGVLELHVPKAAHAKTRRIEIKTA